MSAIALIEGDRHVTVRREKSRGDWGGARPPAKTEASWQPGGKPQRQCTCSRGAGVSRPPWTVHRVAVPRVTWRR